MKQRRILIVMALVMLAGLSMQISDAWARAGSGGSRGSRSYSSPARPSPTSPSNPSSPSTLRNQPASPAMARPGGMFGGGLMSGIAGFALGGLLGRMLGGGMGGGLPARPVYGDRNGYLHANGQNVGRVAPGTTSLGPNGIAMRTARGGFGSSARSSGGGS